MILSTIFNFIIIVLFLHVARLSYSYYASSVVNHYRFRTLYSIGFLLVFQSILAFNYIWFGNIEFQGVRWLIFYITETLYLSMFLKNTKLNRKSELSITSLFLVVILVGTIEYNIVLDLIKVAILITLTLKSNEALVRKYFTKSMIVYGFVSIVPTVYGLTGSASLFMGVLFGLSFAYASKKIYDKEKIDDFLLEQIRKEELEHKDNN